MKTRDAEKFKNIAERLVAWSLPDGTEPLFNIIDDAAELLASLDEAGKLVMVAEEAA